MDMTKFLWALVVFFVIFFLGCATFTTTKDNRCQRVCSKVMGLPESEVLSHKTRDGTYCLCAERTVNVPLETLEDMKK